MKRGSIPHPKVKKLARLLDLELWGAVGILESLWHFSAQYCRDGAIGDYEDGEIADGIGWTRASATLIDALVTCGWLDREKTSRLLVHDWAEHCEDSVHMQLARSKQWFADGQVPKFGRLTKTERDEAEAFYKTHSPAKVCAHKKRTRSAQHTQENAQEIQESAQHTQKNAHDFVPSLAMPSLAIPGQAREDSPKLPQAESSVQPSLATFPDFPCVGSGPATFTLGQDKIEQYTASYPGVDVPTELRKAWQWCMDNPANRKTWRGLPAFLNRWLAKAQDRGHPPSAQPGFIDFDEQRRETQAQRNQAVLDEVFKKLSKEAADGA